MTHELKSWPQYFSPIWSGRKNFEVRVYDRPYSVGDELRLREWNPDTKKYAGREATRIITYIHDNLEFGLLRGYVILGLADTDNLTIPPIMLDTRAIARIDCTNGTRRVIDYAYVPSAEPSEVVESIVPYQEQEEPGFAVWFAVYQRGTLIERINNQHVVSIRYKE